MDAETAVTLAEPQSLMALLEQVPDRRDNRGKEHELAFVLGCVIVALLNNRLYPSAIQRFIANRIEWLRLIFNRPQAQAISRAQLPLVLRSVDYQQLNQRLNQFFGTQADIIPGNWYAMDGKRLRGTLERQQAPTDAQQLIAVVEHESHDLVYQQAFSATASHETREVRAILAQTDLHQGNITLDALHTTPETLQLIHRAQGGFIVQVKKTRRPSMITVKP